ncbi:acyl-CoA dehydrogenase C-terminal domain-containing protein [Paraburkholderia sp. MMS20-SJTN17]|uniref:Acyl-CoA dehydrogenase C-terminal domain-containing protein n=1 Tax=Paraburkholderia translucens TaxID=2886945 RepID=A0ABS8K6G4_9BURK|nr:acyl-CoA dehydrogenase C-terminal domain-containing protein [Paraburkholderia sp. MMS20-SJTN17]MCC8400294.1 acyl-CoA dehydrogenase C-terminal domain-containing protein [Paraburkholderia sp. MMS20-SJTN17]
MHRYRPHADALSAAWRDLSGTLEALLPAPASDKDRTLANANVFLEALGHVVLAWTWLRQALVVNDALPRANGAADEDFYPGNLHACQWFFRCELPRVPPMLALLRTLDDTTFGMAPQWF